MFVFIGLGLFLLAGSLLPVKKQSIHLFISFVILFILFAFRGVSVGTDTANYLIFFNNILNDAGWVRFTMEPGWVFLNDFVVYLGGNFNDLLVLVGFLIFIPLFYLAKKYSYNPMLTIALYYLLYFNFLTWNITRQSVALIIILFGFVLLLKNKKVLFVASTILASTFHLSALVTLPLVFYKRVPENKQLLFMLGCCTIPIGLLFFSYFSLIIDLIGYGNYLADFKPGNLLGNFAFLIIFNAFFGYILLTSKDVTPEIKLFFIFVIIMNLTIRIPFGNRILFYFSIYQVLFYPYYLYCLKSSKHFDFIVSSIIIMLFSFVLFISKIGSGSGQVLPYASTLF
ncbi:EpsG family protein [Pseudoalteromonas prydzensis]|uniref:EpsG family protein n=1 Tax=Pseudoalteromonas prydzensis TaxID=182141 RepID=UPI003FD40236